MTEYVTVSIPEGLHHRARKLARARRRPVDVVIAELLDESLPPVGALSSQNVNLDEEAAVAREMEAYMILHPALKAEYFGQHIAILDGRMIDHDPDPGVLYQRIATQYPNRFVWMTVVEDEPFTTLTFRSPRIVP